MSVVETFISPQSGQVVHLPLDQVRPSIDNPRGDVGDVVGLADSIAANGLIQPIIVHPADDDGIHEIVAGHRRYAAHRHLEADTIACLVRDRADDAGATTAARIVENVQRADLTPADEARAYKALGDLGWSQRDIADAVGVNQSHVSKRASLTRLPADVLDLVGDDLRVEDAIILATLYKAAPDRADQLVDNWRQAPADLHRLRIASSVLQQVRDELARTKAIQKARDAHEAGEGPPLVHEDVQYTSMLRAHGMAAVDSYEVRQLDVTVDQMRDDGTLAVHVDLAGRTNEVCTDLLRYRRDEPDDPGDAPATGPPSRWRRWSDAEQRRTRFLEEALASGALPAPSVHGALIRVLVDVVLNAATADMVKLAALAAGIDCTGSGTKVKERIRDTLDVDRPGNDVVDKACRLAHALTVARTDRGMTPYSPPDDAERAHLEALEAAGYQLAEVEREWLDGEDDT